MVSSVNGNHHYFHTRAIGIDLSTARPKWRLDDQLYRAIYGTPNLPSHLLVLYSRVNHAYGNTDEPEVNTDRHISFNAPTQIKAMTPSERTQTYKLNKEVKRKQQKKTYFEKKNIF